MNNHYLHSWSLIPYLYVQFLIINLKRVERALILWLYKNIIIREGTDLVKTYTYEFGRKHYANSTKIRNQISQILKPLNNLTVEYIWNRR